jgi:outer membrane scaffolding protein for murein synthesis (MipA/OmpV family)
VVSGPTAPPATAIARPATPRAAASPVAAVPSSRPAAITAVDDRKVEGLIAKLNVPASSWEAAAALAEIPSPRAEKALMAAYDRRDYGKMAGAAAFYARKRPPAYEKVLVDLLNQSRDLAVAQDLILAKDPKISEPARKWAAEQGFKLVPSKQTPTGVTWIQN